ncbi:MAG TPA: nuclear transport factor 2 family protein [candidate division Zixibacteria bacterium]|nr:nuclear transport factor 2 family protein [candidate division Zixibacteria bacterium]
MTDDALATAERFYALLDADEIEEFLGLCAEDVEVRYPAAGMLPYGGTWLGRDGVARFLDAHEEAEEILEFDHGPMFAGGDTVLVLGRFTGRARKSGRTWSTRFVHALTIADGHVRRWEAFFDTASAVAARS